MDANRTEDQQVEQIRHWVRTRGRPIIFGLLVGLATLGGVRWYFDQLNEKAEAASLVYQHMLESIEKDPEMAIDLAAELTEEYQNTSYAALGALYSARFAVESDKLEEATTWLQWAIDHPLDDAFKRLATLRLAGVLTQRGLYDQALSLLKESESGDFSAGFLEQKGDIYRLTGKTSEARAAYSAALEATKEGMPQIKELITIKLDNLGRE